MPDSSPCPARSGAPAITGSATPPEPQACPWPVLAGRTGLPLSIWPGVSGPGCPAPGPDHLPCPGPGAVPVIAAFSRPGDLVAVPGVGCPALGAAAARTGRRILGITGGPGGQQGGASCPPGQAALAVTAFSAGLPAGGTAASETGLYAACQRVLRPGGILAIIAGLHRGRPRTWPTPWRAPAPPGSSTPSTSSSGTPPSAAGSSAPSPASTPDPARAEARRAPASTPTCSS